MDPKLRRQARRIRPRWPEKAQHLEFTKLEKWLDLINCPCEELPPMINFGVRNLRLMHPEEYGEVLDDARKTVQFVVSNPRPSGIDFVEPGLYELFLTALNQADLNRVRRCPRCEKFFIASRNDQTACSKVCANAERQRQFRARTKSKQQLDGKPDTRMRTVGTSKQK